MPEKLEFDWHWFNRWRKRDARARRRTYASFVKNVKEMKRKSWVAVNIRQQSDMRAVMRNRFKHYRNKQRTETK